MFDHKYVKERIREIPDYPKKGVLFRDITPMLADKKAFKMCIEELADRLEGTDIDYIAVVEARGFIFGSALAHRMGKGIILIRKKGKLPYKTVTKDYEKEYGKDTIEMHKDSFEEGSSIAIVDDLLATGDTARAAAELVSEAGGKVSVLAFVIELSELNGRRRLKGHNIISLVKY